MTAQWHWVYHITDIKNLTSIIATPGLVSDARMQGFASTVIGHGHIKARRLTEYRVGCFNPAPFVGEFVPFYYCPRSVMLYTINKGGVDGLPAGSQRTVLHLVTRTDVLMNLGRDWAISDGNAGAAHTSFYNDVSGFQQLSWDAINSRHWPGLTHQKCAEFLVRDHVPWTAISHIGCFDEDVAAQVNQLFDALAVAHRPQVQVVKGWYY